MSGEDKDSKKKKKNRKILMNVIFVVVLVVILLVAWYLIWKVFPPNAQGAGQIQNFFESIEEKFSKG